jgi:putative addiction module killer protein
MCYSMGSFEIIDYREYDGDIPFRLWFERLETSAASKIYSALGRMEAGNFSDSKRLKGGIHERRIHSGPGYRIYYAVPTRRLIVLLWGGTKKTQPSDIRKARRMWYEFKNRTN